ncbi:MAG: hypothetical protein KAS89_10210, partial [Candidatus Eisenbacteria sp.]|nr:hypothetical protein [Candidatus Eisenbacteria bacterium]
MRPRPVLHLISYTLAFIALGEGVCWLISWLAGDPAQARWALAVSSGTVLSVAFLLWAFTRGPVNLSRRDGFAIVTFGWVTATVAGAFPYLLSGVISHPVSALFESMSGFT